MQQPPSVINLVENNYHKTPYNVKIHDYPEYWHTPIKISQGTWIARDTLLNQLPPVVFTAIDNEHDTLVADLKRCSHHDDYISGMDAYNHLNMFHTRINNQCHTQPSGL